MNYANGTPIAIKAVSQQGKRIACTGLVSGHGKFGPLVDIDSTEFNQPLKDYELIGEKLEASAGNLSYQGDIGGCILVPDFQWKNPKP